MIENSGANERLDALNRLRNADALKRSLLELLGYSLRDRLSEPTTTGCFYSALPGEPDGIASNLQKWTVWAKPVHIAAVNDCHHALARIGNSTSDSQPQFTDVLAHLPLSIQRICVLLEVLHYLRGFGEHDGVTPAKTRAVKRLLAIQASFNPATTFVMAAWEGYFLLARQVLEEALNDAGKPMDWDALVADDMPWLYIETREDNAQRGRFFAEKAAPDWSDFVNGLKDTDALYVEARPAKWEYQLVALFNHLKHKNPDWPDLLKKLPRTQMRVKDLGLKNSRTPKLTAVENVGAEYFRLGGLVAAMGVDARLQRDWPSQPANGTQEIQALIRQLKQWVDNANKTASVMESDMTRNEDKHIYEPTAKVQVIATDKQAATREHGIVRLAGGTAGETESAHWEMDADLLSGEPDDDGHEEDGLLRVTDRAGARWRDWQGGDALRYLSGYGIRAVIVLRDRSTNRITGDPIVGMCIDWSVGDETGEARFDVIPYWPKGSGLAERVRGNAIFKAEMLDLRAEMGHRQYVLWVEVCGLRFPA